MTRSGTPTAQPLERTVVPADGAPPEGVKMLGQGFAISESNDAKAMYEWYAQWANVMEVAVTPCLGDAEAGPIPASMANAN